MREAVLGDRIFQRAHDVILPEDVVERLWAVFAGKNLIIHGAHGRRKRGNAKAELPGLPNGAGDLKKNFWLSFNGMTGNSLPRLFFPPS
jgi:hypothetical protein